MFLQNEVENYQQIKASDDLKTRIIKNVDATHKKNRKFAIRLAAAMTCLIFAVLGINMYMTRNHMLSIDGVPVLYDARTIHVTSPFVVANSKQEQNLQLCVPLEINVNDEAVITVSEGTLTTDELNTQASTICINKPKNIQWYISKDNATCAICTISTGNKTYIYELIFDEKSNNYNIRQLKNN